MTMGDNLPPFIELPGSSTYPPPFPMQNTNAQIFVLRCSSERLSAVTDQWLNAMASPYTYEPLLPFVFCTPMWMSRITTQDQPWNNMGWMHETDFNFAYLVAGFKAGAFDHVALAVPYLLVDNPLTVMTGREVFGYRKMQAEMDYVAGTYQPSAASMWVFPTFDPGQELELLEVASVNAPPALGAATRNANLKDLEQLIALAAADVAVDVVLERLKKYLQTLNLRTVFLQQIRDAENPTSAAYQALIHASMQITSFNSAWFLSPGFSIQTTNYPGYPYPSDLGIEVDANGIATVLLAFQVNFDCILQPGTVVAVAGRTTTS
jgi:hypothetical protein